MSIIAVTGIPFKTTLKNVVKDLARPIRGHFEALNFDPVIKHKGGQKTKTCYIRVSERLDPVSVVEKIRTYNFKGHRYQAYIPNNVPDLPLGKKKSTNKKKAKAGQIPLKLRMALGISDDDSPEQVLNLSTDEILCELLSKYPGLYNLSKKTGHKLLQELSKKVFNRVKAIVNSSPDNADTCFKTTRAYRRAHPHFGDFQFLLATLHSIQDEAGIPRLELQESDLEMVTAGANLGDMPFEKVKTLCDKYSSKISNKLIEHIQELDSEIEPTDTEEEIARKQVREELKKLSPFVPQIIVQVINKQFVPTGQRHHKIRIYGEPFLPNKETMGPFLARYKARHVLRSTRMYNMLRFSIPPSFYTTLMAMNGTVLNGSKLNIRQSDLAQYKASRCAIRGENADGADEGEDGDEEGMDEDQQEQYEDEA